MARQKALDYSLVAISFCLYTCLGFIVKRHETVPLLAAYLLVFVIYLFIIRRSEENQITFWLYASVLFRFLLLFSVPNLSDDFYRFIWDGRLWESGYHPFAEIPSYYIKHGIKVEGINEELFQQLNSPDYFTIYPPVAQFIFWISVKLSPQSIAGSLVIMKSIVFLCEIGSIIVIKKLLDHFSLGKTRVLYYALNPLVIIELTGNVHLEGVMIFFLLTSVLLLAKQKPVGSAMAFAVAVCVKLLPLMFLPAVFPVQGWKKALVFWAATGATCLLLFVPLWDYEIVKGFQDSVAYYFSKFEFNASIYYIVRAWGNWYYGYNIIGSAGWKLGLISFLFIMILSMRPWWSQKLQGASSAEKNALLLETLLFVLLIYFLFTTTLHPWYITTMIAISVFTGFRFSILWSALIFLTYAGYSREAFVENLWFTAVEYTAVMGYLAYEIWRRKHLLPQRS